MSKVDFVPNERHLLLEEPEDKEQQIGKVILPSGHEDRPEETTVVAIGENVDYEIGDVVYFHENRATALILGEGKNLKKYLIIRAGDIIGRRNRKRVAKKTK